MTFSISRFESLSPEELHDYMEPLLASSSFNVSPEQSAHLLEHLGEYDQYRLVYSLHVCARHDIGSLLATLPEMLSHHEGSVACAAVNILNDVPDEMVTLKLIEHIERAAADSQWQELMGSLNEKLTAKQ